MSIWQKKKISLNGPFNIIYIIRPQPTFLVQHKFNGEYHDLGLMYM